jgi:hypothetical protein
MFEILLTLWVFMAWLSKILSWVYWLTIVKVFVILYQILGSLCISSYAKQRAFNFLIEEVSRILSILFTLFIFSL